MRRFILLFALTGCTTDEPTETPIVLSHHAGVVHQTFDVPVDGGHVVVHRVARPHTRSKDAIVLLHGDFANFSSNFTPMANWLAERGIDVWGIDQRWTQQPRYEPDLSGFDAMGLDQELDDISTALAFVRARRHDQDKVALAGFSRGGQLAYFYASREAKRPPRMRHVKGVVALDVYASLAASDADLRQWYCNNAASEYADLAAGNVDVYNVFQLTVGQHYLADPDAPSLWDETLTTREMMLWLLGQTYQFFAPSENYHLNGPTLDASGLPTGLRFSSETAVATWLATGSWHQALRESADTDQVLCDPTAFDVPLSRIRIPVLSIAAAGGYGARAAHSVAQTSSSDKTSILIRTLPVAREAEDYGHADILFASTAPVRAWQPLLSWLRAH
jgi:pimeloyl-ACP methyl ester carboxylesterase